jgi:4-methylaminobutanoate oxidase (formaldehyde-forming)
LLPKRLVTFTVDDPDALLLGRETIYRDGEPVGWLMSGARGHTIGRELGLGYVRNAGGVADELLTSGQWELEVANRRVRASVHLEPLVDPAGERMRA